MTAVTDNETFWDFSVRTYRVDGVPAACLSLQDNNDVDVNMLLYCCWVGRYFGAFSPDAFRQAFEFSSRWADNVVKPLRRARTWMKHAGCAEYGIERERCMQLRDEIKAAEFSAEKMQEVALERFAGVVASRVPGDDQLVADVAANLLQYVQAISVDVNDDVQERIAIIVAAAFPQSSAAALRDKLRG